MDSMSNLQERRDSANIQAVKEVLTPPYGANGVMPLQIKGRTVGVIGGPYRNIEPGMFGVKMAIEIMKDCDVDIPTKDFNVPDERVFIEGLISGLKALKELDNIYVGCMGGIGRTGLYMAGLAKICGKADPVTYVRANYIPHAVETEQQQDYIANLKLTRWDRLRIWAIKTF